MATLTTVNGVNATLRANVPSEKVAVQQQHGRVRVAYDSYTVDTADEFGTSGLINMMKIPKGARLVDAHVVCPATGATGIFDIGWAASTDAAATVAADADGIFAAIDPGAAAVDSRMAGTVAGWHKTFAEEVQVQCDCTEATADMGTLTIKLAIFYVLD